MARFVAQRFLWLILVLFVVSAITFGLMRLVPGGPFATERGVPDTILRALEEKYNLTGTLPEQYLKWIGDIVLPRVTDETFRPSAVNDYLINIRLDFIRPDTDFRWMNFGPSLRIRSRTVNNIFEENLPISLQLGTAALMVAMAIGIPAGIIAALNRNTIYDYAGMGVAIIGVSIPVIIMGPLLQYLFGVQWHVLPVSGWGKPENVILPAFALGFAQSALLARLTRASLLQVMNEDYIRTARAKGLSERIVVLFHALKNSLIPVVTVLGPLFAALLTGTFVTETIFGIPGMGRFFVTSVTNRDYPVIMGTILLYAGFLVLANMVVDILYAWLDPRIRY
ncbi:MAG: ABC transporter permease [Chloroflexi bacterium]|uniref:ABC transporter permease n=1 Tax=Candidatus Flexifilum breve TaxID=3140694 RepID=UPI00313722BA|nr:ABC transporter permease [Chloroflexota bacterium]